LEKVPLVAVKILEDGDGAVGFLARLLEKFDACGLHEAIVTPEVVGVKEKEDAAGGLIADLLDLFGSVGSGEKQICATRAWRSDYEPALPGGEGRVFHDAEAEGFGKEGECFVVVADEESDMSEGLRHALRLAHWRRTVGKEKKR
jgi:hypothetical protein